MCRLPSLRALLVCAGFLLVGCRGQSAGEAPDTSPASPLAAPAPEPNLRAPLVLRLQEPRSLSSGELEVEARIEVFSPVPFPVTLRATLPQGASLSEGKLDESLGPLSPGTFSRTFRLRTTGALDASDPFRLALQGEALDRSAGVYAERTLPARPETSATLSFSPPSVRRPPAPVPR
ncbi:MAG: hypothetical protein RMJ98_21445 [Myxococcales bacterium]|nr:hypothetical protein [Polyangiaceae bacterium]MDW8251870.1 hypothetical protein [Myxococcales bacterium]